MLPVKIASSLSSLCFHLEVGLGCKAVSTGCRAIHKPHSASDAESCSIQIKLSDPTRVGA